LASGSEEEVEIRAMTVQVVEQLTVLTKKQAIEIDWHLWQQGEKQRHSLPAHHRTLSIYY